MANLSTRLSLGNNLFSSSKVYNQVYENIQEVDNTDGFINILSVSGTKGSSTIPSVKAFCVHNTGTCGAEIQIVFQEWKNNSNVDDANSVDMGGGATVNRYISIMLGAGEFFYLPHGRVIGYNADASAANATTIENTAPNSNIYTDSGADVDNTTASGIVGSATNTTVYLEDGHSKFFKVGDLIRCTNEIMEVTAVGTGADLANSTLTVIRGTHGTTAASDHSDDDDVLFPFFNMTADFDKFSVSQTDKNGIFHAKNFFGYGRTGDAISDGIQAGSIGIKFYSAGYQELGLSGITANTNTGLAASTAYQFTIAVDGGSAYDLDFTTDSSNTNFGGKNGVLNKIQDVFNSAYYTSGNLFEKRVTVSIVNGDVRFTSGQYLSGSAIALGDSSGGDTDIWAAGRIPAVANVEGAVAARLPDDTVYDRNTYDASPNKTAFMYDDGQGNLKGAGSGRINYETGEIRFTSLPNAEFVLNLIHKSAHAGGVNSDTASGKNTIQTIGARSVNPKLNTTVKILAYN